MSNASAVDCLNHPALWFTLQVTLPALLLQLLVGVPLGLYLCGPRSSFKALVDVLVTLPMIFPPMALGFFLLLLLGKNGIIGHLVLTLTGQKIIFSYWGVLIALFLVGLPFMVKSVQAARRQMNESLVEAASTLGKSPATILLCVVLPNIRSGIVTGLLLAFGRSLGEVGISLMLGGNITGRTETLSLAIYNAVFEGDFHRATLFSLMLSVIAVSALLLLNRLNSKGVPAFILKRSRL